MTRTTTVGPMPQIGYGTWNRAEQECYDGVVAAVEAGYRHIDTAEGYNNEEFVGRALKDTGLHRDDYFLTTKVAPESFGPGQIRPHVEASLEKLGVDRVDLLLLHYPSIGDEYEIEDFIAQFAAVYDAGLTSHIGVSNFTKRHLDRAVDLLGVRPLVTNQVECHVFMQNRPIVDHTRAKGISTTAYSPLARGAVADDPVIAEVAAKYGATNGQIALAFLMHEGHIVIPSSARKERIIENLAAGEIELDAGDMDKLRGLEKGMRLVNGPWCPQWDV
ncbi:aldo/keto reductase [Celeribacter sp.]|uniref:aldo/keto reductase n=1 Tax=Celeribacter sp. TaxID=1890673 RepID=UPI003A8D33A6